MNAPSMQTTSLGPALVHQDGAWFLDLAELPILHGLSVLSRALAEMVVAQARTDRFDVAVERRLRAREHPELVDVHGVELVRLVAEPEVLDTITAAPEVFEQRLRALLGSLQRARFRETLLVRPPHARALLARFAAGEQRHRYLLEHVPGRHDHDRCALRITVEDEAAPRVDVSKVPHVVIEDVEDRRFIAGSTRIAETWAEQLRREAERGRRSFSEGRSPHSHLFHQLDQAGWTDLQRVSLQWSAAAQSFLFASEPDAVSSLLKRVLLACEDRHVRDLLQQREIVRIDAGAVPVYLDLSQLGRVLDLSLGRRHERTDVDAFLQRMPVLGRAADQAEANASLRSVRVFLVHHMTAEVVGLIAALRRAGCRDLVALFVTYAGEPPASYLDAVLDLPPAEFRALALVNVPVAGHVEGCYRLSTHYSQLDEAGAIQAALQGRDGSYLPAMRATAVVPFLAQIARAEAAGERCLLVEDGGYLGPVVHDALLRGLDVATFAGELGHAVDDRRSLATLLRPRLITTVEHTRNGFDRLAEVERRHGRLALPAYSIAISHHKRKIESREVAASILSAIETVLAADGWILARRQCLVLGSHGAIGVELMRALQARLDEATHQLFGIDLQAAADDDGHARTLAAMPTSRWLTTDLVLGVTGDSILQRPHLEHWLAASERPRLVLASGSTKKVEFRDVMTWFDDLSRSEQPTIQGRPVEISSDELLDPRTARLYGHRWHFVFTDDGRRRTILALANLSPINFLFYGVATELIDEVLAQLMTVTIGGCRHAESAPPRLLAVDRDVDADGRPLG